MSIGFLTERQNNGLKTQSIFGDPSIEGITEWSNHGSLEG